jgi:hypothetical protein
MPNWQYQFVGKKIEYFMYWMVEHQGCQETPTEGEGSVQLTSSLRLACFVKK